MPNIKSAIKRVKVSEKNNMKNSAQKSALRTSIKNLEVAIESKDIDTAKSALLTATKSLDKAVTKGLIKKNTAARKKSRLTKQVNEIAKSVSA